MNITIKISTGAEPKRTTRINRHFWLSPRGWRASVNGGRWCRAPVSGRWYSSLGFELRLPPITEHQ